MNPAGSQQPIELKPLLVAIGFATAGFLATWLNYRWLNPQLEARTDWLRDTQGFLFTTIPVGTAAAAVVGWFVARKLLDR